jgi:hypothetical protein
MATKEIELDVDFIGEEKALTLVEEKAIHQFLKQKKQISEKVLPKGHSKSNKKSRATA